MTSVSDAIHVLHVDDEPGFADVAAEFLERADERIAVHTATNASEGLELLADGTVHCVVSDYDMPDTNGIEFLEIVREEHPDLPFILYTGKGSEEVASDAISAGVTDYLQKGGGTSQYTVLANRIANAVEQRRTKREAEASRTRLSLFFEQSPLGVIEWNDDFEVARTNDRARSILGYSREELRGTSWEALVPESDREPVSEVVEDLLRAEGGYHSVNENLRGDGERIVCEWHNRFVTDDDGNAVAIYSQFQDITDRKERERELARTKRAMDEAPVGVTITEPGDGDNPVIYSNERFRELTGYSAAEVVGRDCRFLQGEATDPEHVDAMRAALDAEERVSVTLRNYRKDGTEFWNRVSIAPVRDEAGSVVNYVGFQQDVTDQKQRERTLQLTERRYRAVFDDPNILVGLVDTDGDVIDINQTAMDYTEATFDEIVDDQFWATPWFEHSEAIRRQVRDWIGRAADGEYVEFETELLDTEGERHAVEGVFRPVTDQGGEVVSLLVSARDVTARTERERELERHEAYLQESTDIVTVLDESGRIEYESPATSRILGYETGELIGRNAFELVHPDDSAAVREEFADLLAEPGATTTVECRFRTADDDWCWLEVRGTNQLENDAIEGVVTNTRDVTERKRSERELRRKNERLEEFASIVSHDLRNPLEVANAGVELARTECDSDHLDTIEEAHARMDALIEELLTLAREGEAVPDPDPVDLADLAEECWSTVETTDASLVTDVDRPVRADRCRLKQLFENLFRNAVEHGGDDVTVVVSELSDGFAVQDDGPGIPPEEREAVFESGYSTSVHGTGYGLSIVEQVAEAHGWAVRATGDETDGARFEVTGVEFATGGPD